MDFITRPHLYTLYALSGIFLGIGFVIPATWLLGFIGVAIFILALAKTTTAKQALIGGLVAWTTKSLFAISWFWSTYPITWIDLSLGKSEVLVVGLYWLTVSMFLGLGGSLVAGLWYWLKNRLPAIFGILLFPVLWVTGEVFSSLMFSLWTLGEGSTINTVFSFGYLGYLFGYHERLLLLASIGGVYLLSFTFILLSYLGCLVLTIFPRRKALLIISALVLVLWGSSGSVSTLASTYTTSEEGTVVAIIDTRFGDEFFKREDKATYKYEQVAEAVEAALLLSPDYIVLPEDSRYTNTEITPEAAYRFFRFVSSDSEAIVIDSGRVALKPHGGAQRATIYDGISKNGWATDKQYLVPQGEFMPYFYQVTLSALGMKKAVAEIGNKLSYRPGPISSQAHLPAVVPGVLFCFESADPYAVKRLLKERAVPFIAHPISHAWFHQSQILWQQQDIMLKVQALWSNVNIVSAGNQAFGALYTKDGKKMVGSPVKAGESWQVSLVRF